jgi:hypothetical protein
MFAGFNVNFGLEKLTKNQFPDLYQEGKSIFQAQRASLQEQVQLTILPDGSLDGAALERNWFPQLDADIFLSHSHADEETAFVFAGLLSSQLKLKTFVDSSVWGFSADLLRGIDNIHCYNKESATYDYNARNGTTSHVHLMLASALSKMIDNSESVFFLNTPKSIKPKEVIDSTFSPWIYTELSTTKLIRKRNPEEHLCRANRLQKGLFTERAETKRMYEGIVTHQVELSHLIDFNMSTLVDWVKAGKKQTFALDALYKMSGLNGLIKG